MPTPPPPAPGHDSIQDPVEALVAAVVERFDAEGAQALSEICAANPQYADVLRRRFTELQRLGLVGSTAGPALAGAAGFPERLGEFRLIERLGGGGMGVVYLAEQPSLRRNVALKLIRPENMYFADSRERFRREVDAVARLQHPGIVPVYTVGEEQGIPYYAMERVPGCSLTDALAEVSRSERPDRRDGASLADAVARRSPEGVGSSADSQQILFDGSWVDVCARIALRLAEALEHAHSRGVLHRDIKPSNVLLTPLGRVVLVDFGLAVTEGASPLTRSGAQLGSLAYMSPEQTRGEVHSIDARSDVYSLGVLLYESLTLRHPFLADTGEATRQRILDGRAVPPRELNPRISWDVETVCLTAMDRDPQRRYATAAAFARDLQHALERRPIEAKRPGPWLRTRRWVQRNPGTAASAALAFLLFVGAPAGYAVVQYSARLRVESALNDSRESAKLAQEAVQRMLLRVSTVRLQDEPRLQSLRKELLHDALDLYDKLEKIPESDPNVRFLRGMTLERIADMQTRMGLTDDARKTLQQALAVLEPIQAESPDRADTTEEMAIVLVRCFRLEYARQNFVEAEKWCRRALPYYEKAAALKPDDVRVQLEYPNACNDLAVILRRLNRADESFDLLGRAIQLAAAVAPKTKTSKEKQDVASTLAAFRNNYANQLVSRGKFEEADKQIEQALDDLDRGDDPEDKIRNRDDRASLHEARASCRYERGDFRQAAGSMEQAVELWRSLSNDFPEFVAYQKHVARTLKDLADVYQRGGRDADAERVLAEAQGRYEKLRAALKEDTDIPLDLVDCATMRAMSRERGGSSAAGAELYGDALRLFDAVKAPAPPTLRYYHTAENLLRAHAAALRSASRLADARAALKRLEDLYHAMPPEAAAVGQARDAAFEALLLGARCAVEDGDAAEADRLAKDAAASVASLQEKKGAPMTAAARAALAAAEALLMEQRRPAADPKKAAELLLAHRAEFEAPSADAAEAQRYKTALAKAGAR